ncbi:MAG: hypothetical protein IH991_22265, partial [Planctomycetes bacterium]|nr:hypothetical protein [Planctomycetota bacterium]
PSQKGPGGDCYQVSYKRINAALRAIYGADAALPILNASKKRSGPFDQLWGSKNNWQKTVNPPRKPDPKSPWFKIDQRYRGNGAAGALVFHGIARMVDAHAIWEGKLKPGAVLQTWKTKSDFLRVRNGEKPHSIGHSFVFLGYVKDAAGKISGMNIADQGTIWAKKGLPRETFEYWVGANMHYEK